MVINPHHLETLPPKELDTGACHYRWFWKQSLLFLIICKDYVEILHTKIDSLHEHLSKQESKFYLLP